MKADGVQVIAFDADDTLWQTESHFQHSQSVLAEIVDSYGVGGDGNTLDALNTMERSNIKIFGYGIKGFTLSMVETAITLTNGRITANDIHRIIEQGKQMLDAPLELLPGVEDTLKQLKPNYRLLVITKGDLLDQTNKVEKSGLKSYFEAVHVVSEKDVPTYAKLFQDMDIGPSEVMMVGNSVKSDIEPPLEIGCRAVWVPHEFTAVFEKHDTEPVSPRYHKIQELTDLPGLLISLGTGF